MNKHKKYLEENFTNATNNVGMYVKKLLGESYSKVWLENKLLATDESLTWIDAGCGINPLQGKSKHNIIGFDYANKTNPKTVICDMIQAPAFFKEQFDIVTAFGSLHSGIHQHINKESTTFIDNELIKNQTLKSILTTSSKTVFVDEYLTSLSMLDNHILSLKKLAKPGAFVGITIRDKFASFELMEKMFVRHNLTLLESKTNTFDDYVRNFEDVLFEDSIYKSYCTDIDPEKAVRRLYGNMQLNWHSNHMAFLLENT